MWSSTVWNKPKIQMSEEIEEAMSGLRKFLFEHVYLNPKAKGEETKAINMISNLFEYYMEHMEALPEEFLKMTEERESQKSGLCVIILQEWRIIMQWKSFRNILFRNLGNFKRKSDTFVEYYMWGLIYVLFRWDYRRSKIKKWYCRCDFQLCEITEKKEALILDFVHSTMRSLRLFGQQREADVLLLWMWCRRQCLYISDGIRKLFVPGSTEISGRSGRGGSSGGGILQRGKRTADQKAILLEINKVAAQYFMCS